ncbi:hypothetical protein R3P38DRAFT_3320662 [Favolaschia claudopus]|uniref:Uncharacterized protein n=1 Tax=Favolaschia claudopus TaxID=2862362 RepID=A0AAW0AV35_9AGAR
MPPAVFGHRHYRWQMTVGLCQATRPRSCSVMIATRVGRFSPWESFVSWNPAHLSALGFAVHQTSVSLEELLDLAAQNPAENAEEDSDTEEGHGTVDAVNAGGSSSRLSLPPDASSSRLSYIPPTPPSPGRPLSSLAPPPISPPLPPPSQEPPPQLSRQERKAQYHKRRRQQKRQELASNPFKRRTLVKSIPTHLIMEPQRVEADFDAADLRTTKGGHWLGVGDQPPPKLKNRPDCERWANFRLREVGELVGELDYFRVSWDARRPLLILDRHGRIIVGFISGPDDPEWPAVVAAAVEAMRRAREEGISTGAFPLDEGVHRRGRFFTLKSGVSHGGGQPFPRNVVIAPAKKPLVDNLLQDENVRRICGFQSSAFRTWAPKLFKDYVTDLQELFENDPSLRLNFTNSIFPSVTFNLGPQSASFEHLDDKNRALGWCAITSGGDFDAQRSALLYLRELKTVVDFPATTTAFIPSAVVHHGNTPLASKETRYSITQYAAGGLFRYVQYKFRTAKKVLEAGGQKLKRALDGEPGERHETGLDLFSKPEELIMDHVACFGRDD